MPMELFGNLILIKQVEKNYVNYKTLHSYFSYIFFLFISTFISPVLFPEERLHIQWILDSITAHKGTSQEAADTNF